MKILYVAAYPDNEFNKKLERGVVLSQAAQKFNKLYIKGFCLNDLDVDVVLFDNDIDEKIIKEEYNGKTITFYIQNLSGNLLQKQNNKKRHVRNVIKNYKKSENCGIVVIDALCPAAYEITKIAKKHGLNIVTIVTDLLEDTVNKKQIINVLRNKVQCFEFYRQFKLSDYIILLSGAMIEKMPDKNAKYEVFNGICDYEILNNTEQVEKYAKKVLVYTGEIRKMYGIHNLVEAFLAMNRSDAELWLFGNGLQFYPELQKTISENPSVKYMGIKPNDEIVEIQRNATLLINPRLTENYGDYIKYSFPSKNIEYMLSGTPCVTTRLPAISEEYNEFVFFFGDESPEGMKEVLEACLNIPNDELINKGERARNFVWRKLNNKDVTKKILSSLSFYNENEDR